MGGPTVCLVVLLFVVLPNFVVFASHQPNEELGCDGILNSQKDYDACGVCGGTNSTCLGCDNVPNSYAVYDICGVCAGDNTSCIGCDNITFSGNKTDACGVCGGDNSTCLGCDGKPGDVVYDVCGVCAGDNSSCTGCDNVTFSGNVTDVCGVCGGDNSTCKGCDGVPASNAGYDVCGVCLGDNSTCQGCDGIPNSGVINDTCGICGGNNAIDACGVLCGDTSSCRGCDNILFSGTKLDACGVCSGNNASCTGCDSVINATLPKTYDACGVCGGDNSTCVGCDGEMGSHAGYDVCGVCSGNNDTCRDCAGVPLGAATFDACGVCNGNNSTCAGCDGVPYSNSTVDVCGVCLGNGRSCLGCDAIANSGLVKDVCGVCDGDNSTCRGCDGVPLSGKQYDACGVCGGNNWSCSGCDLVPYSKATYDVCGVCGGTNSTCSGCDGVPFSGVVEDKCGVCKGNGATCTEQYTYNFTLSTPVFDTTGQETFLFELAASLGVQLGRFRVISVTSNPTLVRVFIENNGNAPLSETLPTPIQTGITDGTLRVGFNVLDLKIDRYPGFFVGCDNVYFSSATADACNVCLGDNSTCAGCDGVPNSGLANDLCGVCNGNNRCFGCDNVPNSGLTYDACRVCGGDNSTCMGCDNVVASGVVVDLCGVCGGTDDVCRGCDLVPNSGKTVDPCGICDGDGTVCLGCDKVHNSGKVLDECGVCGGTGTKCRGCDGKVNSGKVVDACGVCDGNGQSCLGCTIRDVCGVCNGDQTSCMGCDRIPFSGKVFDLCGQCGGNSSCLGCDGVPNSGMINDQCGVCNGLNNVCQGCDGIVNSGLLIDGCGVCNGRDSSCAGCDGIAHSNSAFDLCGVCAGDDISCTGCDGIINSGVVEDFCGVCGGDTTSCRGCDNIPWSGVVYDLCGVCGGDSRSCWGCDSIPNSGLYVDGCGLCGGDNSSCAGCDGVPYSNAVYDECDVCLGDGTSCYGCDGIKYSPDRLDACGVCNGTNTTCAGCDGIPNSGAIYDICGVCAGGNASCTGCDGILFSPMSINQCGRCDISNDSCLSCDGEFHETRIVNDGCGVCGGDGSSCAFCDLQFTKTYDKCGVCGGQDEFSCVFGGLAVKVQPAGVQMRDTWLTPPKVALINTDGGVFREYRQVITASLEPNAFGAVLYTSDGKPATATTDAYGVAVFPKLRISEAGQAFVLRFDYTLFEMSSGSRTFYKTFSSSFDVPKVVLVEPNVVTTSGQSSVLAVVDFFPQLPEIDTRQLGVAIFVPPPAGYESVLCSAIAAKKAEAEAQAEFERLNRVSDYAEEPPAPNATAAVTPAATAGTPAPVDPLELSTPTCFEQMEDVYVFAKVLRVRSSDESATVFEFKVPKFSEFARVDFPYTVRALVFRAIDRINHGVAFSIQYILPPPLPQPAALPLGVLVSYMNVSVDDMPVTLDTRLLEIRVAGRRGVVERIHYSRPDAGTKFLVSIGSITGDSGPRDCRLDILVFVDGSISRTRVIATRSFSVDFFLPPSVGAVLPDASVVVRGPGSPEKLQVQILNFPVITRPEELIVTFEFSGVASTTYRGKQYDIVVPAMLELAELEIRQINGTNYTLPRLVPYEWDPLPRAQVLRVLSSVPKLTAVEILTPHVPTHLQSLPFIVNASFENALLTKGFARSSRSTKMPISYKLAFPFVISITPATITTDGGTTVTVHLGNVSPLRSINDLEVQFDDILVDASTVLYSDANGTAFTFTSPPFRAGAASVIITFPPFPNSRLPLNTVTVNIPVTATRFNVQCDSGCIGPASMGGVAKLTVTGDLAASITRSADVLVRVGASITSEYIRSVQLVVGGSTLVEVVVPAMPSSAIAVGDGRRAQALWMWLGTQPLHESFFEFVYTTAPELTRVWLYTNGIHVTATFDQDTDMAGMTSYLAPDCLFILDALTREKLGQGPTCVWVSRRELFVSLGLGATLIVGDTFAVKQNALKAADGQSLFSTTAASVGLPPLVAEPPVPRIRGPRQVGYCDDVVLEYVGPRTRFMQYHWSCADNEYINRTLSTESGVKVRLQAANATSPKEEYTVQLRVTNMFGLLSSPALYRIVRLEIQLPNVVVVGPSAIYSTENLVLYANAAFSSCNALRDQLTFVWRLSATRLNNSLEFSQIEDVPSSAADLFSAKSSRLLVPAGSILIPGEYRASVRVAVSTLASRGSDTYFDVLVLPPPVVARILAPSRRLVYLGKSFPLEVVRDGASRELNNDQTSSLDVKWSCARLDPTFQESVAVVSSVVDVQTPVEPQATTFEKGSPPKVDINDAYQQQSVPCRNTMGQLVVLPPLSAVEVGSLPLGSYRFVATLVVEGTTSVAITVVKVVDSAGPHVDIDVSHLRVSPATGRFTINPNTRLFLPGKVDRDAQIAWQANIGGINLLDNSQVPLGPKVLILVVAPNTLQPGSRHAFTLEAHESTTSQLGWAVVEVDVNVAPTGGTCVCDRSSGPALTVWFTVVCEGWTDEQQPLTYHFGVRDLNKAWPGLSMQQSSLEETFGWKLPSGRFQLVAQVADAWGARSVEVNIPVQVDSGAVVTVDSIKSELLGLAVRARSTEQVNLCSAFAWELNFQSILDQQPPRAQAPTPAPTDASSEGKPFRPILSTPTPTPAPTPAPTAVANRTSLDNDTAASNFTVATARRGGRHLLQELLEQRLAATRARQGLRTQLCLSLRDARMAEPWLLPPIALLYMRAVASVVHVPGEVTLESLTALVDVLAVTVGNLSSSDLRDLDTAKQMGTLMSDVLLSLTFLRRPTLEASAEQQAQHLAPVTVVLAPLMHHMARHLQRASLETSASGEEAVVLSAADAEFRFERDLWYPEEISLTFGSVNFTLPSDLVSSAVVVDLAIARYATGWHYLVPTTFLSDTHHITISTTTSPPVLLSSPSSRPVLITMPVDFGRLTSEQALIFEWRMVLCAAWDERALVWDKQVCHRKEVIFPPDNSTDPIAVCECSTLPAVALLFDVLGTEYLPSEAPVIAAPPSSYIEELAKNTIQGMGAATITVIIVAVVALVFMGVALRVYFVRRKQRVTAFQRDKLARISPAPSAGTPDRLPPLRKGPKETIASTPTKPLSGGRGGSGGGGGGGAPLANNFFDEGTRARLPRGKNLRLTKPPSSKGVRKGAQPQDVTALEDV